MNTDEIQCILSRALSSSSNTSLNFRGVYAADRVPVASGSWCCVANTDPHDRPGEHWVALVFGDHGGCEYFDSYAMPLETYPALHKRLRNVDVVCRAVQPVQPPFSTACGHFCIYFLCCRSSMMSLARIVERLLRIPMRSRDSFVYDHVRMLTSTLNIRRPCRDPCKNSQCCVPRKLKQ